MENEKGELVDLFVPPSPPLFLLTLPSHIHTPPDIQLIPASLPVQLRPPQMQRHRPHHQSERSRLGTDIGREGR